MYRYIVSPASVELVARELERAEQRAFPRESELEHEAHDAVEVRPPTDAATTRRPRWVARALRLAH